ncbi:hypothetical protein P168DRAFT_234645 [Aspergillus campestris IBT 28561]|uniref:Tubby C-terminal-like domain-containing protein n=1 Tax=Aspergillus campestris (strain IBT 28561) TaxID=1392248 RepID=A0A2I1D5N2_ASPC2|nr:uncharacterized protein P168DRAFT_234645 [Aspergillus campestris IBT 28561]PKY05179.1 hypothetical protein P168DRAFT_234645 [Aspergillus campestris IBT 28561]
MSLHRPSPPIHLAPPPYPIAIRPERIAPRETELTVQTAPEPWHTLDYTVAYEGVTVFTVRGRPWSLSQRRTFFDTTGLPLFELRGSWYDSSRLDLRLPGTRHSILHARLRVEIRAPRAEITFKNAGVDCGVNGPEVKLEVKDHDLDNMVHVVVLGGRNIAIIQRVTDSRELTEGQRLPFRLRPKWRARVAAGVDLSLIAVLVVIIGQRVAPNPNEGTGVLERDV